MPTLDMYQRKGKNALATFAKIWLITFTLLLMGVAMFAQCDIQCPANITVSTDPGNCEAIVFFEPEVTASCSFTLPTSLPNYTYLGLFGGRAYFASTLTGDFASAAYAAESIGAQLVCVNTNAERNFLNSMIPDALGATYYVGYVYSPTTASYKWVNQDATLITDWAAGQPAGNPGAVVLNQGLIPAAQGWYTANPTTMHRYIIEIEAPTRLINGQASGTSFFEGDSFMEYAIETSTGFKDTCKFTITVEDRIKPVIDCPARLEVELGPLECGPVAVEYDDEIDVSDNCTSPIEWDLDQGPESGEDFELGETTLVFEAVDAAGNVGRCTTIVDVKDYVNPSLACQPVQISLDQRCNGLVTPLMVLTGYLNTEGDTLLGCLDNFDVNILNASNVSFGNTATADMFGKNMRYSITNEYGFSCWNTLTVEDKMPPRITCADVTVPCLSDLETVGRPTPIDNCGASELLLNESYQNLPCDPLLTGILTRVWQAKDLAGNVSAPCTTRVSLSRPNITGITPPPAVVNISCSADYPTDTNGHPSPSIANMPRIGTFGLYPTSNLSMQYCNATIEYKDVVDADTDCKKVIIRTWRILEWHCSGLVERFINVQRINIIDNLAPEFEDQEDLLFTTRTASCSALVDLPRMTITDNCNDNPTVNVNVVKAGTNLPGGNLQTNGGRIELVAGKYNVTYSATDKCSNQSKYTFDIEVKDQTDPVALCDQLNTVNLDNTGYAAVTAASIDNGSYDECSNVTVQIRRMEDLCKTGQDTAWFDKVSFCCLDGNTQRMIQLLVTDAGGNTNMCMVSVSIQEKLAATISCPPNRVVEDCTYGFDAVTAAGIFGSPSLGDNCPASNNFTESVDDDRTNCGIGFVTRTFILVPAVAGPAGRCTQVIEFKNSEPFYINAANINDPNDDVTWPKDYVLVNQCINGPLLPEMLPDSSRRPRFTEDVCDIVGVKYDDLRTSTDVGCYKILRTWKVIDWCQVDDDGEHLVWTYEQSIIVMDNVAPRITSPTTKREVCTLDPECKDDKIVLTAAATDCTPSANLEWSYVITQNGQEYAIGDTNVATGVYPVGLYHIIYEVRDQCNNVSTTEYDFEIRSCKAPTAICRDVVINLVRNGATVERVLSVDSLNNKSYHTCGLPVSVAFDAAGTQLTRIFTCADRNTTVSVPVYVIAAGNGTSATCNSRVTIQDNNNACSGMIVANISGHIATESGANIKDIEVSLESADEKLAMTNEQGNYAFEPVATTEQYSITPQRDGDDLNGVSTIDLVMIQRHILGLDKLKSPYQMIAADVDHNDKLTAADLTELRKLILGNISSFSNNTSWRFVDRNFTFLEPINPWLSPIKESYQIDELAGDMGIDFVGVKVGDVNNNATTNANANVSARTSMGLLADDRMVNIGDVIEMPIYATSSVDMYGLQAMWKADKCEILDIIPIKLDIDASEYTIGNGSLSVSIAKGQGYNVNREDVLFYVKIKANRSGKLSEMWKMNTTFANEIYIDESLSQVELMQDWRKIAHGFTLLNANPNPWITNTSIEFEVPTEGEAILHVYDFSGKTFAKTSMNAQQGLNAFQLSKSDIGAAGVYIYEVNFGGQKLTGKMILMD